MTRPILQRFRQLWPLDFGLAGEIGQGAGHLDHPVQGAQGQIQAFARALQPTLIGLAQAALARTRLRADTAVPFGPALAAAFWLAYLLALGA